MLILLRSITKVLPLIASRGLTTAGSCRTSRGYCSYEGDGKTTVTIHNDELDSPLMLDSYHERGFRLNNGMTALGAVAIFPKTVFSWNVGACSDISPETLALYGVIEPRPDILVIGYGDPGNHVDNSVIHFLRQCKVGFEILPTEHAVTTFNFLSMENRNVAGALIPPINVKYYDDDVLEAKRRRKKLFLAEGDEGFL